MSSRYFKRFTCFMSTAILVGASACTDSNAPMEAPSDPAAAPRVGGVAVEDNVQLAALRRVTARFENFDEAFEAGYAERITPCWAHATHGAMGYHWGNTALFDATVDLLEPETVMYEPQPGGHLKLVGMEYIVPLEAWEAAGHDLNDPTDVPKLLDHVFTRHSFLPIYKLHIWLWRDNPQGMFADWNPKVSCDSAEETEVFN